MSDVLFKCWQCSKNLAVSTRNIGKTFSCPDCEKPLIIPEPAIYYSCPSCNTGLCSPSNHTGEVLNCPACDTGIIVPVEDELSGHGSQEIKIRCPRCDQGIAFEKEHYQELIGKTIDCPNCNRKIPVSLAM